MLLSLVLAGIVLREIPVPDPVLDVRVADIDADGREEVIALTEKELLIIRDTIVERRKVDSVTMVGRGLLTQPKGMLLGGRALVTSPGDLDGDGKDDAVYATATGIAVPAGRIPWTPTAKLEIKNAENFAVEYAIPVPAVGSWTGSKTRELILFENRTLRAYAGTKLQRELVIPLQKRAGKAEGIRRNKVFVEDVDNDGRLDLLIVMAKGSLRVMSDFEITVWYFPGGRIYNQKKKGFYRPASVIKLSGTLLGVHLHDADGDGDKDLSMAIASTSIVGVPQGQYHLFRCEGGKLERNSQWKHVGPVPLSAFKREPLSPVRFLPDLDGDGNPELVERGLTDNGRITRVYVGEANGRFREVGKRKVVVGLPALGKTRVAMGSKNSVVIVEKAK